MFCAQCRAVVTAGSNFCSACGARVAAAPASEPAAPGARGEPQADEKLTWEVRREAGLPLKAYFYWKKKNGRLVRSADFTQSELEAEIERLIEHGEDPIQFVRALQKLARSGGSRDGEEPSVTALEVGVFLIAMLIALALGALLLAFPPR